MNIPNQRVPKLQADQTAIDYTVSRDFAAGVMAEQEKNLQGFLDNGEVELPAAEKGAGAAKNHALQDYQMQLMLVEQQSKKSRLMAQKGNSPSQSQHMATTRKRSRVDTQAEQSRKKGTISVTATKQDATGHDESYLDWNGMRSAKDKEHGVMMTSQMRSIHS